MSRMIQCPAAQFGPVGHRRALAAARSFQSGIASVTGNVAAVPRVQLRVPRSSPAGGRRSRSGSTRGEGAAVAGNQLGRALHPPLGGTGGGTPRALVRGGLAGAPADRQGLLPAARPLSLRPPAMRSLPAAPARTQARQDQFRPYDRTISSAAAGSGPLQSAVWQLSSG